MGTGTRIGTRITYLISMIIALVVAASTLHVAYAQQKPQIIGGNPATLIIPPETLWNPYAPSNAIGWSEWWIPLAAYNPLTGQWWPILAENWTVDVLPNGSAIVTIYLRHGFYWFNGSAVMPFTAWDVYAQFYIGMKVFGWYVPWINQSLVDEDIRVLNNYTIQFLFQTWSPTMVLEPLLTTEMEVPYFVWKPIIDELKTMNLTQAVTLASNITKYSVPYWGLAPYYVSYYSPTYIHVTLEPMYYNGVPLLASWSKIFPFATWGYYNPTAVIWECGSNTVCMSGFIAGKSNYEWLGLSWKQLQVINSTPGLTSFILPTFSAVGYAINPHVYPYNIPQVREALCDVINVTTVDAAWGLPIYHPDPYPEPLLPESINTYPPDVRQFIIPCSYNVTKATQLLESLGFKKINGYWYTPNGTQLSLLIYIPSEWTDITTLGSAFAEQLSLFGVNAKVITQPFAIVYGTYLPEGEYQSLPAWYGGASYYSEWSELEWPWGAFGPAITAYSNVSSVWPFQWPNGTCTPVTVPLKPPAVTNGTIVWCVNSTLGYINLTNWQIAYDIYAVPGTFMYDYLTETIFAWFHYFVPAIMVGSKYEPYEYAKYLMDPNWLFLPCVFDKYPVLAYEFEYEPWGWPWGSYGDLSLRLPWGWVAPPGVVPPLVEAIANGSLWTKYPQYARFIGLPTPDPSLQACVASYFHIPYTPVTTTTTTTTTTSTVTTTAVTTATTTVTSTLTSTVTTTVTSTTTAVSTVTVTKPVVTTALIAGIVVIVVVIAAVAAIITLRRRK